VTSEQSWEQCLATALREYGRLHILVNNAGVGGRFSDDFDSIAVWRRIMDINLNSMFIGTRLAARAIRDAGGGAIVNVSSILGFVGDPRVHPAYTVSKGAVRLYTKQAAGQFAKDGIRVNSVHPGFMPRMLPPDGGSLEGLEPSEKMLEKELLRVPLGRVGHPREVAYGALFLASDEASYITGTELVIDGGFLSC
jgi:NAD(P)-dependent dehydrogenase (short-subunit alcohol dehydrogenase family)